MGGTMVNYKHHHTHITTNNPETVANFYTEAMGLKVIGEITLASGEKAYDLDMGGIRVRVSRTTGADEVLRQEQLSETGQDTPIQGLHHIALQVDNLANAAKELKSVGVQFLLEPKEIRTGHWMAFARCPEGTMYELIQ